MGLRKEAAAEAAARLGARADDEGRVAKERLKMIVDLRAALAEWSERTGIPVRRTKEPKLLHMGAIVHFRTDDRIWLVASYGPHWDSYDETTLLGSWITVHLLGGSSQREIVSKESLGIALADSR